MAQGSSPPLKDRESTQRSQRAESSANPLQFRQGLQVALQLRHSYQAFFGESISASKDVGEDHNKVQREDLARSGEDRIVENR